MMKVCPCCGISKPYTHFIPGRACYQAVLIDGQWRSIVELWCDVRWGGDKTDVMRAQIPPRRKP